MQIVEILNHHSHQHEMGNSGLPYRNVNIIISFFVCALRNSNRYLNEKEKMVSKSDNYHKTVLNGLIIISRSLHIRI